MTVRLKLRLTLLLPGVFFICACRQPSGRKVPKELEVSLSLEDSVHHFGSIPLSQPVDSFDFRFRNEGPGRLVILGHKSPCHCTLVKYTQQPIEPGEMSFVRVIYDGRGRPAEYFNKSVLVYTNASALPVKLAFDGRLE